MPAEPPFLSSNRPCPCCLSPVLGPQTLFQRILTRIFQWLLGCQIKSPSSLNSFFLPVSKLQSEPIFLYPSLLDIFNTRWILRTQERNLAHLPSWPLVYEPWTDISDGDIIRSEKDSLLGRQGWGGGARLGSKGSQFPGWPASLSPSWLETKTWQLKTKAL